MKTEYYVRVSNSLMANSLEYEFSIANKSLHDAEISVCSINQLNKHLPDELKFHGWVTILEYNELDDHSKVTVSAKTANGLNF